MRLFFVAFMSELWEDFMSKESSKSWSNWSKTGDSQSNSIPSIILSTFTTLLDSKVSKENSDSL